MASWSFALVRLPSHFTLKWALKNTLNIFGVDFFFINFVVQTSGIAGQ
ncbi:hypothetical protein HMPREF1991_01794 [Hoylesella loescheii DSM 19665 = JCM 12249 = ATCC 15930]|uniref:Uncharacterized protein n=1 Tax=Hoylesella loescheii DSM 19665 = JCM 12249 = ATCC 15930 TaxID=1122985 RepID=A0A069QJH8_HOYLO|nr:hypothetical protein HMPREF1991_01794 [Hoylesella loescheii DSM 19665 = JCM 12249 = ATCC 15930]